MIVVAAAPEKVEAPAGPYVGLTFYTRDDAAMFFGREAERTVLISNLRASRLTLLYAGSGVGKSSLLRAGVASRLSELAAHSLMEVGTPEAIPVVFSSWRDEPTDDLIKEIRKAVARFVPGGALDELEHPHLVDVLDAASDAANATVLIILDQFEEYFLYQSRKGRFADEVAACLNHNDLRANFLISIREDAYARLGDLFQGRIDNVYGNYLHLENLNRKTAREAIEKPIKRFNELHPDEPPVEIEPAPGNTGSISPLVDAVLTQLSPDQFGSDQTGKGAVNGANGSGRVNDAIAAPYLQLVMKRLWETELENGSRTLRLGTLDELGGAQTIVKTHVDRALSDLEPHERETALDVFRYLVTPSGTKIALSAVDLVALAGDNTSRTPGEVETLLERMSSGDIRILRPVPPAPGGDGRTRFEISHDLLAPAILDWRTRQTAIQAERQAHERAAQLEREKREAEERAAEERRRAAEERRRARMFKGLAIAAGVLLVACIVGGVLAYAAKKAADRENHLAQSRHLAASAEATLSQDPELATLLSLQALKVRDTPEAEAALRASLPQVEVAATLAPPPPARSAMFSSDGSRILTASGDGTIRIYDARQL